MVRHQKCSGLRLEVGGQVGENACCRQFGRLRAKGSYGPRQWHGVAGMVKGKHKTPTVCRLRRGSGLRPGGGGMGGIGRR